MIAWSISKENQTRPCSRVKNVSVINTSWNKANTAPKENCQRRKRIQFGSTERDFAGSKHAGEKRIAVFLMSEFHAIDVEQIDADSGDGQIRGHVEHI